MELIGAFQKGVLKGESPKQAAERELLEETGMKVIRYLEHPYLVETYQFTRGGVLIDKRPVSILLR